jgi:hypothetical protein
MSYGVNTNLGKSSAPGRPAKVKPVVMRQPDNPSGFEFSSSTLNPGAIQSAQEKYLSKHQIPDALRPQMVSMPAPLNQRKSRAISAGWRKPRSAV